MQFKIKTPASSYHLDIYRMGYYGGMGARRVATVLPSASLPQNQPACLTDATTGLIDCGNWAVSASWAIPTTAVSGIYFARLVRNDTGGASHVFFIVRDDSSHSDLLFQTQDLSWQAHNNYGGNNLYSGAPVGRAYKVSYNRPWNTRAFLPNSWVFNAEYPMVRWLEANGYNVSYTSGVDIDRRGSLIRNHKVYLSVGHDEYWAGGQRANVEAARDAGVHLAFFSGNQIFWKTRWENSIDGSNTPYRTVVCYKETQAGNYTPSDPADPPTWTGTWRDPTYSPPADGGRPENALIGNIYMVNFKRIDSIQVPAADGKMRFWRNTPLASLAPGATYTFPAGTLGHEWNEDLDNGFRPAGLFHLSSATLFITDQLLLDYGMYYGGGTATHNLTLYRAPSGALVFGAGTIQWSWGLDSNHDSVAASTDVNMQQATVNLFADMGVQPGTLQPGLVPATASTDTAPPTSTITAPTAGSNVPYSIATTITGTAVDSGGGVVGGVEVSTDGGSTWHPATGRENWSYTWVPQATGPATIRSRAVDDSSNLETPSAGTTVTVGARPCSSCSIWGDIPPRNRDSLQAGNLELGVLFTSEVSGTIRGIRFYKSESNTGTHTGHLWTADGTLLATVTFSNETGWGWQTATFATPVSIAANTPYVASYFTSTGHYSQDQPYFANSGFDNAPLHAPQDGVIGSNGLYNAGGSAFPSDSYLSANYWVDVVFQPSGGTSSSAPANLAATAGNTQVSLSWTRSRGTTSYNAGVH